MSVYSFVFLFWLKSSAFNTVLCFKFHVSGLAQEISLQCSFMFQVSCFWSCSRNQPSVQFYVSSFMFLVLLKNSAFNAVLCFKFHVSGLAKKFGLQCCFMFQFFVFYVSSFMFHVSVAEKA